MSADMPADPPYPPADLRDLASRLSSAPLRDGLVLDGLNRYLQSFRSDVDGQDEHLLGCLDAASALIRSLTCLRETSAEDVRGMVVQLLGLVHGVASTARARRTLESVPAALPSATSRAGLAMINGMAVGEVMVRLGLITPEHVDEALRRQARTGKKFGETLVELGCSRDAVIRGLTVQRVLSEPTSAGDEEEAGPIQSILLGEILVGMGKIDRRQLERGLARQRRTNMRIGAALVVLGFVSWVDVAEALREQQRLAAHAV